MGVVDVAPSNEAANPCVSCGACCAYYRASFYWSEADDAPGGTVPVALTEKLNDFRRVMRATSRKDPRCIALLGTIGQAVRCSIYELRSSVCRDFPVSWEQGIHNERCDQARLAWGLPPVVRPADLPDARPEEPGRADPDRRAPQAA
ncbi:MAG: YkgJ family cysteine cluster protein [Sedimentisphaerales bacterium]|nr:YkgJ family cysteine cluster protein [Sedimentisphaerales bacterium]